MSAIASVCKKSVRPLARLLACLCLMPGSVAAIELHDASMSGAVTISGNSATLDGTGTPNESALTANTVKITGNPSIGEPSSPAWVAGGRSNNGGTVSGNTATINTTGGTITGYVSGGYSIAAGGQANGNFVNILGGSGTIARDVMGGYGNTKASNNTVILSNGTIDGTVFGGYRLSGEAINNTVTVESGFSGNLHAIMGSNTGTYGDGFTGNTLNINETASISEVANFEFINFGHDSYSGISRLTIYDGQDVKLNVNSGATVMFNGSITSDPGNTGSITKTGAGTLAFSSSEHTGMTTVQGGTLQVYDTMASRHFTLHDGTTLIYPDLLDDGSLTVYGSATYESSGFFSAKNAQLNFYIPSTMTAGGTLLRIINSYETNIADSTVNVGIDGQSSPLGVGDSVTLIDVGDGKLSATGINTTANGQGMQGVTLQYEFDITATQTALQATVTKAGPTEQSKALSEGYLAGMTLVNQGADAIAGQGMEAAVRAAHLSANREGFGLAGFGTIGGGRARYNTGSHVDVNSVSLLTGLSFGRDLASGRLTSGAFFEYGNGSYDTRNSFTSAASVKGDGDTRYIGGGLLVRMDFSDTGPGHFYTEATGRAGSVHNKYKSDDLRDSLGRKAKYDSSSAYYGLHLGAGYLWNLNDKAALDLYAKYFWTHQERDSATLSTGDSVRFKDVDSHRLRLGTRLAYTLNQYVSPYVGAAYEHEFDGRARATTNGYSIQSPDLTGDTGIGELGLSLRPSQTLPLFFDLGVQGYTGKREGVTGSLQIKFEF
ncbi:MAG: autotransporter domain-containing protein [Azoarcus sp.]|nr:autotransporter domain-containing protein [Azoarcus sp.]